MFVHVSMQEDYVRSRENMERKPGDWNCRSCQYVNCCRRDSCQRCGEPKLGVDRPDYTSISGVWDVKPGDWYCSCGVHNYASRSNCFKCGAAKDDSTAAVAHSWGFGYGAPAGWKSGDWICTRSASSLPICMYAHTRTHTSRCSLFQATSSA